MGSNTPLNKIQDGTKLVEELGKESGSSVQLRDVGRLMACRVSKSRMPQHVGAEHVIGGATRYEPRTK
jgi:hypothetical protein